jgi:hypothetical protein
MHELVLRRAEIHADIHVKCPLLLSDYNPNWNVSINFSKTLQLSNFMKVWFLRCHMQIEGQTEMAKLKGIFLQFSVSNKPKKGTTEKYVKMQI